MAIKQKCRGDCAAAQACELQRTRPGEVVRTASGHLLLQSCGWLCRRAHGLPVLRHDHRAHAALAVMRVHAVGQHELDALELMHHQTHALVERVEGHQPEHGDEQPRSRGQQRFAHAAGDRLRGRPRVGQRREGVEHADDGAQQTEQRRQGDDGVEHPQPAVDARGLIHHRFFQPVGEVIERVGQVVLQRHGDHLRRRRIGVIVHLGFELLHIHMRVAL